MLDSEAKTLAEAIVRAVRLNIIVANDGKIDRILMEAGSLEHATSRSESRHRSPMLRRLRLKKK